MARCTSCGAELPDYYTSCPNCGGTQVVRTAAAPQAQSYAPPIQQSRVVYSMGQWLGWLAVCGFFPLVGVIVMLCVAKDPSARNYAKLMLILYIIAIVIYAVLAAIMIPAMIGYTEKARAMQTAAACILPFIR